MTALLNSPEIQTAVLPFVIALIIGLLLRRRYQSWVSAGVIPGFVVSALLINGFTFTPLTGTRKIILLTILAYLLALIIDVLNKKSGVLKKPAYLPAMLALLAAVWVVWPLLGRIENIASGFMIGGGLLYVVMQVYFFEKLDNDGPKAIAGILSLGIGTGASAILAASALYGQLSLAIVNAAVAILILSIHNKVKHNQLSLLSYPASMLLGLLGLATMVFAELPWYTLVMLVMIPAVIQTELVNRLIKNKSVFLATIILFFVAMLPALIAVMSIWLTVEDTSY